MFLFKCLSDAVHFDFVNVPTQRNSYNCGVLSIAMATELALGHDPATCQWDTANMRPHLKACFEQGMMTPFPTLGRLRVPLGSRVRHTVLEKVYCIPSCRMPNEKKRGMIFCDTCHSWFHFPCVSLDPEDHMSSSTWSCPKCQDFLEHLN